MTQLLHGSCTLTQSRIIVPAWAIGNHKPSLRAPHSVKYQLQDKQAACFCISLIGYALL
jgi:hypothetical protein